MMIEVNYVHFHNLNRNVLDLGKQVRELSDENARLKAHIERLTKAGDWVMSHWSSGDGSDEVRFCQALLKWKNAKEGKQP
jgi:hypothetical protein